MPRSLSIHWRSEVSKTERLCRKFGLVDAADGSARLPTFATAPKDVTCQDCRRKLGLD